MLKARELRHGRGGVFWQTQGSGKSLSMVFFAQKVFRKIPGNWTFVIVTDRAELDDQIAKTFKACGAVSETESDRCHAENSAHLRELLTGNHRYVFTLIHKFRTEPGQTHPVLSERRDIIVINDEAHRTQYDTLALNMRTALPNAIFLAFTGTPLLTSNQRNFETFRKKIENGDQLWPHLSRRIENVLDFDLLLNEHPHLLVVGSGALLLSSRFGPNVTHNNNIRRRQRVLEKVNWVKAESLSESERLDVFLKDRPDDGQIKVAAYEV
jgi:hypothetical protein